METEQKARFGLGPRCPFCRDTVAPDDRKLACDACMTWHHQACWDDFDGRCSSCHSDRAAGGGADPAANDAEAERAPPVLAPRTVRPGPIEEYADRLAAEPALPREAYATSGWTVLVLVILAALAIAAPILIASQFGATGGSPPVEMPGSDSGGF